MSGGKTASRQRDAEPRRISAAEVGALEVFPAGAVDLRRDLHVFLRYVEAKGLLRTKRANHIPKTVARRLAKLLSWSGEADAVQADGSGWWSDRISHIARDLGLVSFDTKGVYEGYSSTEPSYPDNEVVIEAKAWRSYLRKSPLEKERALLRTLVTHLPSEFFAEATIVPGAVFDKSGCARGPASRMKLPKIRRRILDLLGTLETDTWYAFDDLVALLGARHPQLILDPETREPDAESLRRVRDWERQQRSGSYGRAGARGKKAKASTERPEIVLEDLYANFRERDPVKPVWDGGTKRQLSEKTPGVFRRVEGRYLEFFLREIPYLLGFVDLGYRPDEDAHGLDVSPPFERLQAVRLSRRFASFQQADPDFGAVKVTVLPTFEVLVESDSYPETVLDRLEAIARPVREEGPLHTLRIDRKRVAAAVAEDERLMPAKLLEGLAGRPLPQNVIFDLDQSASRGTRLVLYEGFGVLEMLGDAKAREAALAAAGDAVETALPAGLEGFALVRDPEHVFERLEGRHLVPERVHHPETGFASSSGRLGAAPEAGGKRGASRQERRERPEEARLKKEDLVGYRSTSRPLLDALFEALSRGEGTCVLAADDLLVVSASKLPALRKAVRRLASRFEVTIEEAP